MLLRKEKIPSEYKDGVLPDEYYNQKAKIQHPSLEIAHFCTNSSYKQPMELSDLANQRNWTLGIILFWQIIAEKVIEISSVLGMDYVHLFAADNSDLKTLISYYRTSWLFVPANTHCLSTVQEEYDDTCPLMIQKLSDLKTHRQQKLEQLYDDFDHGEADADAV